MSTSSPAPEPIAKILRAQIRQRTHLWDYILIPVLIVGTFVGLWILLNLFGGTLSLANPVHLMITTVALSLIILAGRWSYRYIEKRSLEHHPSIKVTLERIGHLEQIATNSSSREDIVEALRAEIESCFHPQCVEIAMLHQTSHYHVVGTDFSLSTGDPFVEWLIRQPVGLPIALPVLSLNDEARATQADMIKRGVILLTPLGQQGWVGMGAPEAATAYDEMQQNLLQYLVRPVVIGLERTTIAESQQMRAQELQSLYWIAQSINFAMQIDDLLELIYTQLQRVMTLPNFYIALKQADEDVLSYAFYIVGDERLYPEATWPLAEGLTGVVIANSMTIRTDSYANECARRGIALPTTPRERAWMAVPLSAGDRSIGVMVASTFAEDTIFSTEDENFFVTVAAYTAAILERQSLYERLATRARQLGTLNEIGNLLASSLDLDKVLDLVVRSAAKLLNSEAGSLLLLDDESGDLVFQISSGPAGEKLVGMRMPAGKGIAGAAFSENRPVITHDTHKDQRWDSSFDRKAEFSTQSIIAVPLNARGRTIGVLEVLNRKDARAFNREDSDLLTAFGAQAAIAIENAQLFTMTDQALQARLEELTTLQQIDRQLNATLDYSAVMGQTLDWAIRITGATIGLVAALQEEEDGTGGLRFLAHRGYPDETFTRYAEKDLWPVTDGLLGLTIRTGETSLVQDVTQDPNYKPLIPDIQAQLTVPIKREDRVIGAIVLESHQADSFQEENTALIMRLADHAAIAIENARLFQQVQEANEAKTEFISFVSHELKQPMTSMRGYADLLIKGIGGQLSDQQQQFTQVIRNNVERMDRLVQDLLDVSRIESGRLRLEKDRIVPEDIVSEAVQAFEQEIVAKNQNLRVDMPPSLPPVIGDRGRLIQVLTNMVSNANKYTPEGGTITVSADLWFDRGRDYVRWSVNDNGIGMKPEEMNRLFTKYFRASNAAVRSVQGTGLGLVITRSIVELHDGQVMVDSEYQKGSTFSFAIPIAS